MLIVLVFFNLSLVTFECVSQPMKRQGQFDLENHPTLNDRCRCFYLIRQYFEGKLPKHRNIREVFKAYRQTPFKEKRLLQTSSTENEDRQRTVSRGYRSDVYHLNMIINYSSELCSFFKKIDCVNDRASVYSSRAHYAHTDAITPVLLSRSRL